VRRRELEAAAVDGGSAGEWGGLTAALESWSSGGGKATDDRSRIEAR